MFQGEPMRVSLRLVLLSQPEDKKIASLFLIVTGRQNDVLRNKMETNLIYLNLFSSVVTNGRDALDVSGNVIHVNSSGHHRAPIRLVLLTVRGLASRQTTGTGDGPGRFGALGSIAKARQRTSPRAYS